MRLTLLALIALRNQTIFLLFSFAPFIVQFADEKRAPEALIDGAYRACRVTRLRYPNAPSTVYSRPVSCQTPSSQPSFSVALVALQQSNSSPVQLVPAHSPELLRCLLRPCRASAHSTRATHCASLPAQRLSFVPFPYAIPHQDDMLRSAGYPVVRCLRPSSSETMRLLFGQ